MADILVLRNIYLIKKTKDRIKNKIIITSQFPNKSPRDKHSQLPKRGGGGKANADPQPGRHPKSESKMVRPCAAVKKGKMKGEKVRPTNQRFPPPRYHNPVPTPPGTSYRTK